MEKENNIYFDQLSLDDQRLARELLHAVNEKTPNSPRNLEDIARAIVEHRQQNPK